jgi:hypothetical protein
MEWRESTERGRNIFLGRRGESFVEWNKSLCSLMKLKEKDITNFLRE